MSAGLVATGYRPSVYPTYQSQAASVSSATSTSPESCSFSPAALQAMQSPTPATEETARPEHAPAAHASSGGGLLGDIGNFFSGAANTVANAATTGVDAAGNFFTRTVPDAAKSVARLPFQILAGHYNVPAPGLPAYPTLNAAEKQKAMRPGQSVAQPVIRDTSGNPHEPVSLIYNGNLSTLQKALQSQGWSSPDVLPMSEMKVHGKPAVLSLQKNAQLGGLSRDHLRVFQLGPNRYGIAATRDLHPDFSIHANGSVSFGHVTDNNINGERDLVMNDILHADPSAAKTWQVVQGKPDASLKSYNYDGQVYEFSLPQT